MTRMRVLQRKTILCPSEYAHKNQKTGTGPKSEFLPFSSCAECESYFTDGLSSAFKSPIAY